MLHQTLQNVLVILKNEFLRTPPFLISHDLLLPIVDEAVFQIV